LCGDISLIGEWPQLRQSSGEITIIEGRICALKLRGYLSSIGFGYLRRNGRRLFANCLGIDIIRSAFLITLICRQSNGQRN